MTFSDLSSAIENLALQQTHEQVHHDSAAFNWQSASASHAGRVRHNNQDALLESVDQTIWCVSDGMGGLTRGDYASAAVIQHLQGFTRQATAESSLNDIKNRIEAANDKCRTAFKRETLGATAAIFLALDANCYLIWAGDSRAYRLRNGELLQLTVDHTLKQAMLDGELKFDSAEPSSHVLTRAVGIHRQLKLAVHVEQIQRGDRFLLCTDGLYNPLKQSDLGSLLGAGEPERAIANLQQAALDEGGPDNITGIVIDAH